MARFPASPCFVPWPTGGSENDRLLALLSKGDLNVSGMMPWSSNYTFLGTVSEVDQTARIIYKPIRGERPLWDFPRGTLAKREVAAYVVCRALGWDLVPPTVLRGGPHGRGSVQFFVDVNQDDHFFTFRDQEEVRNELQRLAAFDIICNNADRKGGHCLRTNEGCIVAIDQGLCFHVEPKLRTVIWDFAGELVPPEVASDLLRLKQELGLPNSAVATALARLLYDGEIVALRRRIVELLDDGCFPAPPEDRRPYPWPLI